LASGTYVWNDFCGWQVCVLWYFAMPLVQLVVGREHGPGVATLVLLA